MVTEPFDVGDAVVLVGLEQSLEPRLTRLRVGEALAMISTSSATALFTEVPMGPDELSTCSSAGDTRLRSAMAPSTASIGSFFATFLISVTACLMRVIAGCDFQPNGHATTWESK